MKVLYTRTQLTLQVATSRVFTALRRATPEDREAQAAAAFVTASVSPTFDELRDYAETHGLTLPDRDLYEATMRQLAEIASFVTLAVEEC